MCLTRWRTTRVNPRSPAIRFFEFISYKGEIAPDITGVMRGGDQHVDERFQASKFCWEVVGSRLGLSKVAIRSLGHKRGVYPLGLPFCAP